MGGILSGGEGSLKKGKAIHDMNAKKGRVWAVLAAGMLCVSGCATVPEFSIQIDSEPQGARVEVNHDYIGDTPVVYTLAGNDNRTFDGGWVEDGLIVFVVTPPFRQTNLYTQKKSFRPSGFFEEGDRIPERMFFDLRRPPEGLQIRVNP